MAISSVSLGDDADKRWVVASDHAGWELKDRLAARLRARGFAVTDLGTHGPESVDYPDYAFRAARDVAAGRYRAGLLCCGTGLGMSYAANRVRGVRAALCWSVEVAGLARSHNDADILVLPGRVPALDTPEAILDAFLATPGPGAGDNPRHLRRIAALDARDAAPDGPEAPEAMDAVAIDGPAGAGKSTVARALAGALGWRYLDTGAMYRAVTLAALRAGVDLEDASALAMIARDRVVDFDAAGTRVCLDGVDVSADLRAPEVTVRVRYAAKADLVRRVLRERQRKMAMECPAVLEGRDIGTVVLPGARWKFFLTASAEERARRRAAEMRAAAGPQPAASIRDM